MRVAAHILYTSCRAGFLTIHLRAEGDEIRRDGGFARADLRISGGVRSESGVIPTLTCGCRGSERQM